jgi:hypothetical protein
VRERTLSFGIFEEREGERETVRSSRLQKKMKKEKINGLWVYSKVLTPVTCPF